MGKGAAVVPNAQTKNNLNREFGGLRMTMKCYQYLLADHWLIYHIKIPSTHQRDVYYDVVIEIDKAIADEKGIDRVDALPFRCYSNCPSFIYTYAKVFYDKGLLIDWMTDKYDEKTTRQESKERNVYGLISYERSLYLACRFIMSNHRNLISNFIGHSIVFHTPDEIKKMIQSGDQVMKKYNKQMELEKKEKENKKKDDTEKQNHAKESEPQRTKKSNIKSISKIGKIKKSKGTSGIKKIH